MTNLGINGLGTSASGSSKTSLLFNGNNSNKKEGTKTAYMNSIFDTQKPQQGTTASAVRV